MADDTTGKAKHLGGKVREKLGEALGDRRMRREGQLDQAEGAAEQDEARAEEEARQARERRAAARGEKRREDLDR